MNVRNLSILVFVTQCVGGIAARASEVNSETKFALDLWGVSKPDPIEELLTSLPSAGVCLVDHQQTSQLNKSIDVSYQYRFLTLVLISKVIVVSG